MEETYLNVMVDLESMGVDPDAPIISIGAVVFDPDDGTTGAIFSSNISLVSSAKVSRINPETVLWWMSQTKAAQEAVVEDAKELSVVLLDFSNWLQHHERSKGRIRIWGNGAAFDNVMLRGAYQRLNLPVPWEWWNDMCYRTLKTLNRHIKPEDNPEKHSALADAMNQTKHLIEIFKDKKNA